MKNYAGKWILQRVTAIVLIPLTFWFVYNCISFSYLSFDEIIFFFSSMLNSFLFLILMMSMFLHAKIGCETILDDYITFGLSSDFRISENFDLTFNAINLLDAKYEQSHQYSQMGRSFNFGLKRVY